MPKFKMLFISDKILSCWLNDKIEFTNKISF